MRDLTHQKCFIHGQREAVAVCLDCHRTFCRECITEHQDRVICSSCLKKASRPPLIQRLRLIGFLGDVVQGLCGLLIVWMCLYGLGRLLLQLPSSFHEGSLWEEVTRGGLG